VGEIINVKEIIERKKLSLKEKIEDLKLKGISPKLVVIHANHDEASNIYISKKRKMCEELAILEEEYDFDETVTQEDILQLIEKLNNDKSVHGILVQLPIYKHLDTNEILESISPKKDVDGFHPVNIGKIMQGTGGIAPCTPKGVMAILDELNIDVEGKNATVIGRSIIVGRPMGALLLNKGATVTTCHSKTKDLAQHTKNADILVVAVGKPHLVTEDMVKEGAIVIDVGINRVDGKLVGDVDTENVAQKANYITPVPGGVGLTTVYTLMENVVELAEQCK
jgi:methylenetetrahydrofolate dehydrogenase (NADP+)/methenyltetrahydrofolate cyclohydrolase